MRFLFFGVMPLWGMTSLADYVLHRRSRIETAKGATSESLVHGLMLLEASTPILLSIGYEATWPVVATCAGLAALHEATGNVDLRLAASSGRTVSPLELQVHSVLELMPFVLAALLALGSWPQLRVDLRSGDLGRLRRRHPPRWLLALAAAWISAAGVAPYGEELWRCRRAAGTPRGEPVAAFGRFGRDPQGRR